MNKDQTNGNVDQLKGELKKQYGKLTNNESKEAEGKMEKMKGQAKETWGDAKEALSKTFNDSRDLKKVTSKDFSCWLLFLHSYVSFTQNRVID